MQQQTHLTSNKIPRQPKKYGNRSCFARLKKNFILKCLTTTGVPEIRIYVEKGLLDELSESAHKKAENYLNTSRLGRGGQLKVTIREEAYAQTRKNYGFFALVSNKAEGCFKALRKYRVL